MRTELPILGQHERVRRAALASATGSPDSVRVRVDVAGNVVVDDRFDRGYVEAASGHVSRDQNRHVQLLELVDDFIAVVLVHVSVQ